MHGFVVGTLIVAIAALNPVNAVRHIVFIVADDLGWNDIGFLNKDIITPNIDALAEKGVILNSSYVQPVCTPSRHAFMTGFYPFKAGLQRVIGPQKAECSPLNLKFLPEELKDLGYATHMVGKWHLGFCNWNCTPTYRGFDTFYGFYNGMEDYYTKERSNGIDFRDGETPAVVKKEYSAEVFASRAVDIINSHDSSTPMFLYLPFQSVHSPVQVPKRFENMYPNIKDDTRRQFCGMVSAMDEAVDNITQALENSGLMNDTLIIFTSDNGGMPMRGGNNYPLRGAKTSIFEGGTRAAAFVYGSGLVRTGYTYDGLIHAVDWYPTIVAAAGGNTTSNMDGINQWDSIRLGDKSQRTELVYSLDNTIQAPTGQAAIRVGDYKLVQGFPGLLPDWYKPPEMNDDRLPIDNVNSPMKFNSSTELLFNLLDDPTEHSDISKEHPDIVKNLADKLDEYRKSLVAPQNPPDDPASLPENNGGYWSPGWC